MIAQTCAIGRRLGEPLRSGWTARSGWPLRPYALLCLLCLVLYPPGLAAIPVLDRDEARFAQATRQMLETGDFLRIRFQDEARNNKPAGIYWLQAAAVAAFSTPESDRDLALSPAVADWRAARGAADLRLRRARCSARRAAGMIAAVLLATALGTRRRGAYRQDRRGAARRDRRRARGARARLYPRPAPAAGSAWSLALRLLAGRGRGDPAEGPDRPGAGAAHRRRPVDRRPRLALARGLRPLGGLVRHGADRRALALSRSQAPPGAILSRVARPRFLSKLVGAQESHGAPPGYYLALAIATFWPGSLLLAPALIWGWRQRARPAARFLLAWLVPAWVCSSWCRPSCRITSCRSIRRWRCSPAARLADGRCETSAGRGADVDGAVAVLWGRSRSRSPRRWSRCRCVFGGDGFAGGHCRRAGHARPGVACCLLRHWRPLRAAGLVAALALAFVVCRPRSRSCPGSTGCG